MSSKRFSDVDRELDTSEIDGEPFQNIIDALEELSDNESLLLINSFEPEPLYDVLERRGFAYETANLSSEEWHVKITNA